MTISTHRSLFRRESSTPEVAPSEPSSALKRQRRATRKTTDTDEAAAVSSQIVISADRMNAFKTHLSTLIDRQSSVTTQEILTYMSEHDATFTDAEIQMALAKMQDDNQIMLAGDIVIRI